MFDCLIEKKNDFLPFFCEARTTNECHFAIHIDFDASYVKESRSFYSDSSFEER